MLGDGGGDRLVEPVLAVPRIDLATWDFKVFGEVDAPFTLTWEQFKQLPEATKARIAELQKQANDLLAQATTTYGDFAGRGKQAVDEVRRSGHAGSSEATRIVTPRSSENASDGQDEEGHS